MLILDEPTSSATSTGPRSHRSLHRAPLGTGLADGSAQPPTQVMGLAVYDDGSGPALFAGGSFRIANGQTVSNIAKWDGVSWSSLNGPNDTGVNRAVRALAVYNDGTGAALYAGGWHTAAGGVTVNHVAKWDGANWSALSGPDGIGVNMTIYALSALNDGTGPALYAGGDFTSAAGVEANHIARWDGTKWTALIGLGGNGVDARVRPMTTFHESHGPAIYVGGHFSNAGSAPASRIARWRPARTSPADLNGDGVLDLADITIFVFGFATLDPVADFAEPFGVFDLADIMAFISAFEAGCP